MPLTTAGEIASAAQAATAMGRSPSGTALSCPPSAAASAHSASFTMAAQAGQPLVLTPGTHVITVSQSPFGGSSTSVDSGAHGQFSFGNRYA